MSVNVRWVMRGTHMKELLYRKWQIFQEKRKQHRRRHTHTGANPSQQGAIGLKRLSYKFISHIPEAL